MNADKDYVCGHLWHLSQIARQQAGEALSRVPTASGWLALHAQPLAGGQPGDVAVTIQAASGTLLLPAVAAWHGLTPRERAVTEHTLLGLTVKQIAHRLDLSTHTITDHLKAIYRKTGVNSRDELTASLNL